MSRSGYSDDLDPWDLIRWRGAVNSALKGTRGQRLLRDMAQALDAMPVKRLIAEELQTTEGEHCALGVLGVQRGVDVGRIDPYDRQAVAQAFDIAPALAAEISFINDDDFCRHDTPEQRWQRVREWVEQQIKPAPARVPAGERA